MPQELPALESLSQDQVRKVRTKGEIKFKGHLLYAGQAFAGLQLAFRPSGQEDCWDLFLGWKKVGRLDLKELSQTDSNRWPLCRQMNPATARGAGTAKR